MMNLHINTQISFDNNNSKTVSPSRIKKDSLQLNSGLDSARINKFKEIWLQIEEREMKFYNPE
jgi:hypothetical protein